jgi:hypothetical protein
MFITKVLGKIGLTIIYPVVRVAVLNQLDQLSGTRTGFFEGIKNIWVEKKPVSK